MISTAFIIHGSYGSPFENWFPPTYEQLSQLGIKTFVPHFPSPQGQTFENWARILDSYYKQGLINQETIFVAHSSGCAFILKYAFQKRASLKALITVAGFNNFISGYSDFDKINSEFFQSDTELNKGAGYFSKIHSFYSDNDPNLPLDVLKNFSSAIDANEHLISGGGHFNEKSGYSEFPAILDLCSNFSG